MANHVLGFILFMLFCINRNLTFDCVSPLKTIKNALDIQSHFLHEYVKYVNCQRNHEHAHWQGYVAECFRNTSCIGIVTTSPPATCTLFGDAQNVTLQIEDLWLILDEFERLEGTFLFK